MNWLKYAYSFDENHETLNFELIDVNVIWLMM